MCFDEFLISHMHSFRHNNGIGRTYRQPDRRTNRNGKTISRCALCIFSGDAHVAMWFMGPVPYL